MPQGSKAAYTDKQKRKAAHIRRGYLDEGVSPREATERAWRTVNKQDGGARKRSSARSRGASARRKAPTRRRKKAA